MRKFVMCPDCQTEYEQPLDRRFHAQPNACPVCGPQLALYGPPPGKDRFDPPAGDSLTLIAEQDEALRRTGAALSAGQIVAVKGLGGFHLMVDAGNAAAVARLREHKPRRAKPFAVMARDLVQAQTLCRIPAPAETLLTSAEAPIVLLRRRPDAPLAGNVAPDNPNLGIMLPYTPLHHLLLAELDGPVVATSGNLSDEPICTGEDEARRRLGHIADCFLIHNRPIERHVDDSVAWILEDEPRLLRRARGYAPLPVLMPNPAPTILAVGAHLKNTVALSVGQQVFISQHIGDLETAESMAAFERVIADFLRLYEAAPAAIARDMHPDYLSTHWAQESLEQSRQAQNDTGPLPGRHSRSASSRPLGRVPGREWGRWPGPGRNLGRHRLRRRRHGLGRGVFAGRCRRFHAGGPSASVSSAGRGCGGQRAAPGSPGPVVGNVRRSGFGAGRPGSGAGLFSRRAATAGPNAAPGGQLAGDHQRRPAV